MSDTVIVAIISGIVTLGSIFFGIWSKSAKEKTSDDIETRKEYNKALVAEVQELKTKLTKKEETIDKLNGVIDKWVQEFYELNTKFQVLVRDKEINDAKLKEALDALEKFKGTVNEGMHTITDIKNNN
jgi:chromosome segregation ATPase